AIGTSRAGRRASAAPNDACCHPPYDQSTPTIAIAAPLTKPPVGAVHVPQSVVAPLPNATPSAKTPTSAASFRTVNTSEKSAPILTPSTLTIESAQIAAIARSCCPRSPIGARKATYFANAIASAAIAPVVTTVKYAHP